MTKSKSNKKEVWSGGGENLLSNALLAKEKYPDRFSQARHPVIFKNVVPLNLLISGQFIYIPQNAWAWHGSVATFKEFTRKYLLRITSQIALARASKTVRIGPMIPETSGAWHKFLPNTLDESFENALDESRKMESVEWLPESRYFLAPGSFWSYRNHRFLIDSYKKYRDTCTDPASLVLVGPASQNKFVKYIENYCSDIDGIHIVGRKAPRAEILRAMSTAELCLFPSLVEASPVSILEAAAIQACAAAFDIPGHRHICSHHGVSGIPFFSSTEQLVQIMSNQREKAKSPLNSLEARAASRDEWIHDFLTLCAEK